MSSYIYDTMIFVGRFQPFHVAHLKIIKTALEKSKQVIIIIGSSHKPRTFANPWFADERKEMIRGSIEYSDLHDELHRIKIATTIDTVYNTDAWLVRVQNIVNDLSITSNDKVAITGHKKLGDSSTFYLDMFPQWEKVLSEPLEPLNATDIRKLYFQKNHNLNYLKNVVPHYVSHYLKEFRNREEFNYIIDEHDFIVEHNKKWQMAPFAPTFNTADAVVTAAGHALMIIRKNSPGKGLMAFPGGYLDVKNDISIEDCAIRELQEETNIKLQTDTLRRLIKEEKRFDFINRSSRGRIITTAFHFVLDDKKALPKVNGGDDADSAFWVPISEIKSENCFEDHYDILSYFVGKS